MHSYIAIVASISCSYVAIHHTIASHITILYYIATYITMAIEL